LIFELAYWGSKIDESRTKSKKMGGLSTKQQKELSPFIENNTQTMVLGKTPEVLSLEKMGILRHMANDIGERAAYFLEDWYFNRLKKHPNILGKNFNAAGTPSDKAMTTSLPFSCKANPNANTNRYTHGNPDSNGYANSYSCTGHCLYVKHPGRSMRFRRNLHRNQSGSTRNRELYTYIESPSGRHSRGGRYYAETDPERG